MMHTTREEVDGVWIFTIATTLHPEKRVIVPRGSSVHSEYAAQHNLGVINEGDDLEVLEEDRYTPEFKDAMFKVHGLNLVEVKR